MEDQKDRSSNRASHPQLDLIILEIYTLITAICTQIPFINDSIIITILGFPFLTFIPGYALISILYPNKDVGGFKRLGFSVTISLLISLLYLVFLYQYPTYNVELIILILLLFLTLILCFLAYLRRLKLPEKERFQVQFDFHPSLDRNQAVSMILLVLLFLGIIGTVYLALTPPPGEKFTEFYILGPDGKANYTTDLSVGERSDLTIGVVNHEQGPTTYRLLVRLEGTTLLNRNLTLNNSERQEINVTFTPSSDGNQKLEFLLFKQPGNQTQPYRELYLWYRVGA